MKQSLERRLEDYENFLVKKAEETKERVERISKEIKPMPNSPEYQRLIILKQVSEVYTSSLTELYILFPELVEYRKPKTQVEK